MGKGTLEDLPGDQRREDGVALTYTSQPIDTPLTILGRPRVDLNLAVDRPLAQVAVRLSEVTPTGSSRLVARGLLNLTHRHGHEVLEPMTPGAPTPVALQLSAAGHIFGTGSRIRVAVSPTYWPWAWPSPEPVTLTVFPGPGCALTLPVRESRDDDGEEPSFVLDDEPHQRPIGSGYRQVHRDKVSGRSELVVGSTKGPLRLPDRLELVETSLDLFSIMEGDPLSAEVRCERTSQISRDDWQIRIETMSTMSSDATTFRVTNAIDAYEGDTRVATRRWNREFPRDGV